MDDLHGRLLAALPLPVAGQLVRASEVNRTRAALRAVLERHKPVPCRMARCTTGHVLCAGCGSGRTWQECPDTLSIAEALGVQIGETS